jgi:hypothetical protein
MIMNFTCCKVVPNWVENVPGKGYFFCSECRKEVLEPLKIETLYPDHKQLTQEEIDDLFNKIGNINYP